MKIGLLTFHAAHNYGAVLQAYATQETIKEMGLSIEVIDYNPPYLIKQRLFPFSSKTTFLVNLKIAIEGLITLPWKQKRISNFQKFVSAQLQLSKTNYHDQPFAENNDYDVFIMGSDQVWNCKLTKGFDPVYLGNFKIKPTAKRISYAASMSHYALTPAQVDEFSQLLNNFKAISVREEELRDYLDKKYAKDATVVLDPTLLLSSKKWSSIAVKPNTSKKYVLVYSIDLRNEAMRIAHKIASEIDAEVIELTMSIDKNVLKNKYQTASPEEYIGLFEHAEFVVTSSFHGTAFSLIFNKPFFSIAHGTDKDSRQKTILNNLGVLDRFIAKDANPSFEALDFTIPNQKLNAMRETSIQFLKNNI